MSASVELRKRAQQVAGKAPSVFAHTDRALAAVDKLTAEHAKQHSNAAFTAVGRRQNMVEPMKRAAHEFARSRRGVERDKARMKADRESVVAKVFAQHKDDPLGAEIRGAIRAMPIADALRTATGDSRVLAALVNAPAFLHHVPPEALQNVVDAHIERTMPMETAKLTAKAEAIQAADAALELVGNTLFKVGEFPSKNAFDSWLAETVAPSDEQIAAEAAGQPLAGQTKYTMTESMLLTNSDALCGVVK